MVHTYHGNTAVRNGTLKLGTDNALPVTTSVTQGNSTTSGLLDLAGKNQTIAGLSSSGSGTTNKVIDTDATVNTNTLTLNVSAGTQTVRNLLGDATNNTFSLKKDGLSTLIIGGVNTYTGSTVVNQGTLQLSGGLAPGAKIMPLGDSITDGTSFGTNAGYRGPLYNSLVAGGYTTQYVGTLSNNIGSLPAAPTNQRSHEGHSGWVTGDVATGILHGVKTTGVGGLGWLTTAAPDVVLLHIGTNNTGGSEPQSITDVTGILDEIHNQRPNAVTYVAQIIPKTGATAFITQYNLDLATLVAAKQAAGYFVYIVDMNTTYPAGALPDNVHPNDVGYNFMANQWYAAINNTSGSGGLNVLPVGTNVSVAAGATLDLNGVGQTVASLSDGTGGGGTIVNNAATGPITLTINPASGSTTFSGAINDNSVPHAISVIKTGIGTQILAGNNTYRGTTTISAGILTAGSSSALGSGTAGTTVNAGGTLGLQDIAGPITISGETLTLNGLGAVGQPGALVNVSGNNLIAASSPITAQVVSLGQVGIGSTLGTLMVNANIDLTSSKLVVDGSGATTITGIVSGTGADVPNPLPGGLSGVFTNVTEASAYSLAYELNIPDTANFNTVAPNYAVDNSAAIATGGFDRVAYYLELTSASFGSQWVYASLNSWATDETLLNVPNSAAKIRQSIVSNMNVFSNVPSIVTGTGIATGNVEFWPTDYAGGDGGIVPGGTGSFDFDDTRSGGGNHGSMQIHNYGASQTIFAYNNWGNGGTGGALGIGNRGTGDPDWTFASNAGNGTYTIKRMAILVRETTPRVTLTSNALVKQGTGTLTLSAPNTFNAGTTITNGTLLANNTTG